MPPQAGADPENEMRRKGLYFYAERSPRRVEPSLRLASTGQTPSGPLAGNRDGTTTPAKAFPERAPPGGGQCASRVRPVSGTGRTRSRSGGFRSTATLGCAGFAIVDSCLREKGTNHTAKSGCATTNAKLRQPSTALSIACAMISCRLGGRAELYFVFREAGRPHR